MILVVTIAIACALLGLAVIYLKRAHLVRRPRSWLKVGPLMGRHRDEQSGRVMPDLKSDDDGDAQPE